jgi:tetratricopeptide (TPR) repeat protein
LVALETRPFRIVVLLGIAVLLAVLGCAGKTRKAVEGEKVLTHVVSTNETLESIADDYYGDPKRADEIRDFNLLETDDPTEGEVVRVYMTPEDLEALARRKEARVPYNAGLDMVRRGSYLDAVSQFKRAIELDPGFAEAAYNLGVTFQKLDSHEKAIGQFEDAIELRPENPQYYFALGNSYYHLQRYDRAVRSFEQALSVNPADLKAQFSLALSLEKSGNKARARREWQRYLDMDGDSEWAERARARLAELEQ